MAAPTLPRSYYRVVGASGVSNLADGIRLAAFPLLAISLTNSALLIALVFAAGELPRMLLGFWAGGVADRLDRQRLAARVAIIRATMLVSLGVLILAGLVPLWLVVAAAFVLGVGEVLADSVSDVLVPLLVAPTDLERANSRLVGVTIVGNELIGPALGGLIFTLGASLPFFSNATLLALAFLLLAGLPALDPGERLSVDLPVPVRHRGFDGVPFLRANPMLSTLTWSGGLLAAVDAAWFSILVVFVHDELGYEAAGFGMLLAIGAVGGLGGAWLADRRPNLSLVSVAIGVFAATAMTLVALALRPNPALTALALIVTSFVFAVWNVFMVSARQRATPNELMGRVGAAYRTVVVTCGLVGALIGGLIADATSLRSALIAYGIILAVATPLVGLRLAHASNR